MRTRRLLARPVTKVFSLVAIVVVLPALAADSEKQRPLDRQLLQELNSRGMDEVDRELFGPEQKRPQQQADPGQDMEKQLSRELGGAAISEDESPLLGVARKMRRAEGLLREAESGPATQQLQQKIVADLDELLKQAQKNCAGGQCKPSNSAQKSPLPKKPSAPKPSNKPSTSGAKAAPKSDPNASPPAGAAQDAARHTALVRQIWGELPEAERQRMQAAPSDEKFLPKYELLIEQYYRRLLEERKKEEQ